MKAMENWKVELAAGRQILPVVKMQIANFQRNSLVTNICYSPSIIYLENAQEATNLQSYRKR